MLHEAHLVLGLESMQHTPYTLSFHDLVAQLLEASTGPLDSYPSPSAKWVFPEAAIPLLALRLLQVTGDPNVPHSELTFRVRLTRPVDTSGTVLASPTPEPDFRVPPHHSMDVNLHAAPPLQPLARYQAQGL